ncbi:MAG: type II CAAX endopeptidase family protein [Planctomycetota bacterium]
MNRTTVWTAAVLLPVLYALARLTPWGREISFTLHWGLAISVIVWAIRTQGGTDGIGLKHAGLGLLAYALLVTAYCAVLIGVYKSEPLKGWQWAQIGWHSRWAVAFIAISAGFCEEVIFRGFLFTALKRTGNPLWLAMPASTLSFVLFHGILPLPLMVIFFIGGMIFVAVYHKTKNLWVTVVMHGVWDATVLLIPMESGA